MKRIVIIIGLVMAGVAQAGLFTPPENLDSFIPPEGKYNVTILRDEWGVPHIKGKTDADCAYGLAWAHSEDDYATLEESFYLGRGKLALRNRYKSAPFDFIAHFFRFQEIVAEKYETDLSPEVRAICEAFADGCNHYVATHPEKVSIWSEYPVTGQDVVVGFAFKAPFFFGMDNVLMNLMTGNNKPEVSGNTLAAATEIGNMMSKGLPIGSNTIGVAPSRTPDGKTHLAINSHQPYTGPVAWYEAHLMSEEGWNCVGGIFPGAPVILHGHNPDLGWAHTVNSPDMVDLYELEINPENPNQYKYDGEWRDLEVETIDLEVRLWGAITWTVKQEALYSVYGPTVRRPFGTYAIRYATYGDIRQVEQWFKMNKATNIDEFEDAMRMRAIPSLNVGYADKEGNIWYLYNATLPIRAEGYDWKKAVPGNTSETLWTEYLPFDDLPQVRNPESGFFQNCNGTPFKTTVGEGNPKAADYSPTFGIETHLTNRGLRANELFGADDSITEEDFYAYKYDTKYSKESQVSQAIAAIQEGLKDNNDPILTEALEALGKWDYDTTLESQYTALVVYTLEPVVRAMIFNRTPPDPVSTFTERAKKFHEMVGGFAVPWGDVNRLVRGDVNLPLTGGPDTLHAVYGEFKEEKGYIEAMAGDCYVLMVSWDKDGKVHSNSIHQFGSATLDESSPHYADQAPLFANLEMKPVWMSEEEIRQHLEAEYKPGEERPAQ